MSTVKAKSGMLDDDDDDKLQRDNKPFINVFRQLLYREIRDNLWLHTAINQCHTLHTAAVDRHCHTHTGQTLADCHGNPTKTEIQHSHT